MRRPQVILRTLSTSSGPIIRMMSKVTQVPAITLATQIGGTTRMWWTAVLVGRQLNRVHILATLDCLSQVGVLWTQLSEKPSDSFCTVFKLLKLIVICDTGGARFIGEMMQMSEIMKRVF